MLAGWTATARRFRAIVVAVLALAGCAKPEPAPSLVYVSDERGDKVVAVDLKDGRVVQRIAAGRRPRGILLSPDGATLFVAVSGSAIGGPGVDESKLPPPDRAADGLAVIDTATGKLRRVLQAGSDPETFALSPDGRTLFVANEDDSLVSAIDAAGNLPTRQVKVGDEPEGIVVTPNGGRLFVACEASDVVLMLDAHTLKQIASTTIEGRPRSLLASADGETIYASVETAGKLAVISAKDGRLLRLIDLARGDKTIRPMGMAEVPGGRSLFVTTGRGGALLEVDPLAGRIVRRIDGVGARPWGIVAANGGRTLVTANGPSGDISLVDRADGKVRVRYKVGVGPWGLATTSAEW